MVRLNSFQVTKETRVIKIYRHLGAPFPAVKRQTEQSGRKQRKKQDKKGSRSVGSKLLPENNILQASNSSKRALHFQEKHDVYILLISLLLPEYDLGTFAKSSSKRKNHC